MILAAKAVFALGCMVAMPIAYRAVERVTLAPAPFDAFYLRALLGSRLLACLLAYVVLGLEVPSDAASYYMDAARGAAAGGLAYRDFETNYAPLFPYVGAALLMLRANAVVFVWAAIGLEWVCARAWLSTLRETCADELRLRRAAALYLFTPMIFFNVAILGQNQVWIAASLALSVLWLARRRELSAGGALAASVVSVKFLPLSFAPVLWLRASRSLRFALGFALPCVAVYGAFWWYAGDAMLEPVRIENRSISPGNLPYLVAMLTGASTDVQVQLWSAVRVLCYLGLLGWCFVRLRRTGGDAAAELPALLALVVALLYLSSHKAFAGYLVIVGWPLCWALCDRPLGLRDWLGLGLLSATSTLESSLMFRALGGLVDDPGQILHGGVSSQTSITALALEALTVAAHTWLVVRLIPRRSA